MQYTLKLINRTYHIVSSSVVIMSEAIQMSKIVLDLCSTRDNLNSDINVVKLSNCIFVCISHSITLVSTAQWAP